MGAHSIVDGNSQAWKDRAACRKGWDPEMWFPEAYELNSPRTKTAQKVCGRCPVRAECYDYGRNERIGIWGGVYLSKARRLESLPETDVVLRIGIVCMVGD